MTDYLILIILHLIGDFYFQSTKVARCKNIMAQLSRQKFDIFIMN